MAANSRFAVAVHTAVVLARRSGEKDEWVTSDYIAQSVNTNPVVIRKLICSLAEAGIAECRCGKTGGARLKGAPRSITLLKIYEAVSEGALFAQHGKPENKACIVSCAMKQSLAQVFLGVEDAVRRALKKTTLEDLIAPLKRK